MRVLAVLAVVLVVGLIAGAYASGTEKPTMTREEARVFTRQALEFSGVREPKVGTEVSEETFRPEGSEPVPVYVVPAEVAGFPLKLYVQRNGDQAVNLDDALPDGGFVLTDEQFEKLAEFRFDPAAERVAESRRGPATVAGALVLLVGVALLISVVSRRSKTAPSASG
ncbi:MAG TPA: hypothetical protein VGV63_06005 [Acidimicrobiales bacterium]|nr:hypothetical protein [Acidimicrobiales bacterium]